MEKPSSSHSSDAHHDRIIKAALSYRDPLLAYAFAKLRNWEEAEDVLHDAYLVIIKKADTFRDGNLFLWCKQILYYKIQEAFRKNRRSRTHHPQLQVLIEQTLDSHLADVARDFCGKRKTMLRHCMMQLSPDKIRIIEGFYWQHRSCHELARVHRRSVNAIKLILSRTRNWLRKCVQRRMESQNEC